MNVPNRAAVKVSSINPVAKERSNVSGGFIERGGQTYYLISDVDQMPPFFISLISSDDHWLFASSNGGLTAGRVSPETALFPYITVDKIYDSALQTGPRTIVRVDGALWEPFNPHRDGIYDISRNLYKHWLGNEIIFEEHNETLGMVFSYSWQTSAEYGFVRQSRLENKSNHHQKIELLDGLQNILPAGTPRQTQSVASNLVDAYKWSEIDSDSGLGLYSLYSAITDRAEPAESLNANAVFLLSEEPSDIYLDSPIQAFRRGNLSPAPETTRGIRGNFFSHSNFTLTPGKSQKWSIVANIDQSAAAIVELKNKLGDKVSLQREIDRDVDAGTQALRKIMASADGFQQGQDEMMAAHHYSNVVFNVLRGGIFPEGYQVTLKDIKRTLHGFNRKLSERHADFLDQLPASLDYEELLDQVAATEDPQLIRLVSEYLPITFGRRHGDPSRPWNQFRIDLKDEDGGSFLSYEGNWRDIFQNWEALCLSYPLFVQPMIAKFVNASTADGYNPYRITKQGIDWEVEDPEDPWSYIGYWGDHQIIYLLKLLELSNQVDPEALNNMLHQNHFSYAQVPYKLTGFSEMVKNSKDTVTYDQALADKIEARVESMGADGKLILDAHGEVYQVSLTEKLLVPLLTKLSNLVLEGGIWLNTQRPEWNDANNALVGQGLSVVTLCYLYRYLDFLNNLFNSLEDSVELSAEVANWLQETSSAIEIAVAKLDKAQIDNESRFDVLSALGQAATRYREAVYRQEGFSGKTLLNPDHIKELIGNALRVVHQSVLANRREDGLYHSYNTLKFSEAEAKVDALYPMLEGQVAVLSSGVLGAQESLNVLESLYASDIYRPDQKTFMLYPDRQPEGFLNKNCIPSDQWSAISLLGEMAERQDTRICEIDSNGDAHFSAELTNEADMESVLASIAHEYGAHVNESRQALLALYENTFQHHSFTGRSGGMFGFEGLGCVYWHMVGKLLVAAQESWRWAVGNQESREDCDALAAFYHRVREGIGFNKAPEEYGAFPMDPYSHTPKHAGAQQPGMTGQVKEEILTRFGELGVIYDQGSLRIEPGLLKDSELVSSESRLEYMDTDGLWQTLTVPENAMAFTLCQVPIILEFMEGCDPEITICKKIADDEQILEGFALSHEISQAIMKRTGNVTKVHCRFPENMLFKQT